MNANAFNVEIILRRSFDPIQSLPVKHAGAFGWKSSSAALHLGHPGLSRSRIPMAEEGDTLLVNAVRLRALRLESDVR